VTAPISIRDFARAVLPPGADGVLRMLRAYFDDSGTHGGSDIVLVGGIFGYPNQIEYLSDLWAKKLSDPSPGKLPLRRFHMANCHASMGEFAGWNRTATDYLVHELGDFILKSAVWGFAAAIERKPYDELITGDLRRICGEAETFCYINCFRSIRRWAREFTSDRNVVLIFDDRPPDKKANVQKIYDAYDQAKGHDPGLPEFASASFASSLKVIPLQAADMIAWEFYQDSMDTLRGRKREDGFRRKQLARLVKHGRFRSEMLDRHGITKLVQTETDLEMLAAMAQAVNFS
jgi:hypothetical protein